MAFLHGLGSYVASRGGHWDSFLDLSDGFFACRENTASQTFQRSLVAIDYKVKRQELHRDDIKCLIDVTAARMEMYHLVGALLVTASIAWLADASFTESYLPSEHGWFVNLLFISNISAIGYLILCVWFAMYARNAAQSIGTRLLLNYARLSLPTSDELNRIKAPIFFNAGAMLRRNFQRSSSEPDLHAIGEESMPSEDFEQHLRLFLRELPRWLVYDAWSRVCLSFGMLLFLQAMSYYTLGIFWPRPDQPAERWFLAFFAFCAVRILTGLLWWVDFKGKFTFLDVTLIAALELLGPGLCIGIISEVDQSFDVAGRGEKYWVFWSSCIIIVFAAHAAWLAFLVFGFHVAPRPGYAKGPFTYQAVNFAYDQLHDHEFAPRTPVQKSRTGAASLVARPLTSEGNRVRGVRLDPKDAACPPMEGETERVSQEITDAEVVGRVNGGREPGTWLSYTRAEETNFLRDDLDRCRRTDWLPVKATRCFSLVMVAWWLVAGMVHAILYQSQVHTYFQPDSTALLSLNTSSEPTGIEHVAKVQWPEPFFEVTSLYCSDSRIWVSNGFSVFAVVHNGPTLSRYRMRNASSALKLAMVREGHVDAIFCRGHGRSCQSIRKNTFNRQDEPSWSMDTFVLPNGLRSPVAPSSRTWGRILRHAAVLLSIPSSWRLLAAEWASCPLASADCGSASLAGWDGTNIFIATLQKDVSGDWAVHMRFKLNPQRAVCDDGLASCHDEVATAYEDVHALQLSTSGDALTVLRSGGVVEEWNLPKRILKRWRLDASYTAMCRSGKHIYLSRQGTAGPMLTIVNAPKSTDESKRSKFVVNGRSAETSSDKQPRKSKTSRHSFLHTELVHPSGYGANTFTGKNPTRRVRSTLSHIEIQ